MFYLSGIQYGKYHKRDVFNLARFISCVKLRPLTWRMAHPYALIDRFEVRGGRQSGRAEDGEGEGSSGGEGEGDRACRLGHCPVVLCTVRYLCQPLHVLLRLGEPKGLCFVCVRGAGHHGAGDGARAAQV